MVVHDLHIACLVYGPDETNPKLIVDPNAVLPGAISLERLQSITGKGQVAEVSRLVKLV